MNNRTIQLLWLAAGVMLAVGAIMTMKNVGQTSEVSERLGKMVDELKALRGMEADLVRYETAKQMIEKSGDKHPVPLGSILQAVLPNIKAEDTRDSRKDIVDGWLLRQKEISLNDVPVAKAVEFVQKAEAQKLPWCMVRCVIRAAPKVGGPGQVILLMEALEKAE